MIIRELNTQDITMIWKINEEGLPGTGKVSEDEIKKLLNYSELSLGAFDENELLGVVICLLPRTEYGSLNYAWFIKNYHDLDSSCVNFNDFLLIFTKPHHFH